MGNAPFRMEVGVDGDRHAAGATVTGRVRLEVSPSGVRSLRQCRSIRLQVEGYERVGVATAVAVGRRRENHEGLSLCRENANNRYRLRPPQQQHQGATTADDSDIASEYEEEEEGTPASVEESKHVILRCDFSLGKLVHPVADGHHVFPFAFRLPADLPASAYFSAAARNSHTAPSSFAEVRYRLTSYLSTGSGWFPTTSSYHRASTIIEVVATDSYPVPKTQQPLLVDPEEFPVHSCCCCWGGNGKIQLGWQLDRVVCRPGDRPELRVLGENRSDAVVKTIRVLWIESVSWKTLTGQREVMRRTLAEMEIPVHCLARWLPMNPSASPAHVRLMSRGDERTEAESIRERLHVPADACDSYDGRLIQVRHVLKVVATTAAPCTSSPESSCAVRVSRVAGSAVSDGTDAAIAPPEEEICLPQPKAGESCVSSGSLLSPRTPLIADSQPVPTVTANAVTLPEATAVLVDNEAATRWDSPTVPPPPPRASAPDESLLWCEEEGQKEDSCLQPPPSQPAAPSSPNKLEQLKQLVREGPENLPALLEDPEWCSWADKGLPPDDYASAVLAAGPGAAADVAHTLAVAMGHRAFGCRHILACVRGLTDPRRRKDVLWRTASLASDLTAENQQLLEEELTARRAAHATSESSTWSSSSEGDNGGKVKVPRDWVG